MRLIDADKIDFNEVFVGASEFAQDTRVAAQMLIDGQPTVYDYDIDRIVESLQNCPDSATFRYDKKTGVLYEVEANVIARIADGLTIPLANK